MRTLSERALSRTSPINLWQSSEEITTWTSSDLKRQVWRCTNALQRLGVREGDTVAFLAPTSVDLVAALLATWACRCAMSILPVDAFKLSEASTHQRLRGMLDALEPKVVVYDGSKPQLSQFSGSQTLSFVDLNSLGRETSQNGFDPGTPLPQLDDPAVVQWTSGSTGPPKAILLTHRQFAANCEAIVDRAALTRSDHMVSWLPLNHDMGLSAITVSIWADASLTLIPTENFVRSPPTWLEAISHFRATGSPAPAFAYGLLARRAKLLRRLKLDLSSWRYAWIGAEPVFPDTLAAFAAATAELKFSAAALKPSYGLAEAVVAVSAPAATSPAREICVDRRRLRSEGLAEISTGEDVIRLVSNGPALDGVLVRVGISPQEWVSDGAVGRVWISGIYVTSRYMHGQDGDRFSADGWFNTVLALADLDRAGIGR